MASVQYIYNVRAVKATTGHAIRPDFYEKLRAGGRFFGRLLGVAETDDVK